MFFWEKGALPTTRDKALAGVCSGQGLVALGDAQGINPLGGSPGAGPPGSFNLLLLRGRG
jgi:hypothetical protein